MDSDKNFKAKEGTYQIYMIWFDALKLRLRTDWIERLTFAITCSSENALETYCGLIGLNLPMSRLEAMYLLASIRKLLWPISGPCPTPGAKKS